MAKDNTVSFVIEKGVTICNNTVFNLPMSTIEKLTYLAMVRYGGKNKQAWPANETLAECVSCSKRRVVTAVNCLEKHGLVVKNKRNNKTNIYYINPPESFCPVEPVKKAKSKARKASKIAAPALEVKAELVAVSMQEAATMQVTVPKQEAATMQVTVPKQEAVAEFLPEPEMYLVPPPEQVESRAPFAVQEERLVPPATQEAQAEPVPAHQAQEEALPEQEAYLAGTLEAPQVGTDGSAGCTDGSAGCTDKSAGYTDGSAGCTVNTQGCTADTRGCKVNTQGCTTDTRGCTWFTPGVQEVHPKKNIKTKHEKIKEKLSLSRASVQVLPEPVLEKNTESERDFYLIKAQEEEQMQRQVREQDRLEKLKQEQTPKPLQTQKQAQAQTQKQQQEQNQVQQQEQPQEQNQVQPQVQPQEQNQVQPQAQNQAQNQNQAGLRTSIHQAFEAKGMRIPAQAAKDLLAQYEPEAIMAAIDGTCFKKAVNPLNVVFWMLKYHRYVSPTSRPVDNRPAPAPPVCYEPQVLPPETGDQSPLVSREEISRTFRELRERCQGKVTKDLCLAGNG